MLQKTTTLARKLGEMNPFMKVEFCESLAQNQQVSVVISSLNCFSKANALNEECRKLPSKPAFYSLNCSGLFGFAFVDLQKLSYSFAEKTGDGEQT